MVLLYKFTQTLLMLFFLLLPISYGDEREIERNDKGFLASEWSGFHDVVFAIIVIVVILLIITFMKKPDDVV